MNKTFFHQKYYFCRWKVNCRQLETIERISCFYEITDTEYSPAAILLPARRFILWSNGQHESVCRHPTLSQLAEIRIPR